MGKNCFQQGLYPAILGKGHWPKIINLLSKLGKIIDIKHNYRGKIYPKNQVILDCFMPSNILICVIDSHQVVVVCKKKNIFFTILIGKNGHAIGKNVAIFHWKWGRNSAPQV